MSMKRTLLNLVVSLSVAFGAIATSAPAYAAAGACPSGSSAKAQVLQGLGQTGNNCSDAQVNNTLQVIGSILSIIIGIAAVIAIIASAFKYITSGGDQNKVANAKGTLLYAVIGLAIAGLAQFLIHFVVYQTSKT